MKTVWNRLLYRQPGMYLNPFVYPFLLYTFVSGIAFVFFEDTGPVKASVLFQLTIAHAPDLAVSLWGLFAIMVPVMVVIGLVLRLRWWGEITTWLGFGLWVFATIIFALYGFWLQVLTVGMLNLSFWVWYWFMVREHYNNEEIDP